MEAFNNQTSHPAEPATTESGLRSPRWRRSEDQQTLSFSDVDRMNGRDETLKLPWYQRWWKAITGSLNFYRIHLLTFTFVSSGPFEFRCQLAKSRFHFRDVHSSL
jgi:hypothetical protein